MQNSAGLIDFSHPPAGVGSERLFNELTHKWLDIVRYFYLHGKHLTPDFHRLNAYYICLKKSLDWTTLLKFQKLLNKIRV